jgi:hypothetical protein
VRVRVQIDEAVLNIVYCDNIVTSLKLIPVVCLSVCLSYTLAYLPFVKRLKNQVLNPQ